VDFLEAQMHRIIQLNLKILSLSAPTGSLEVVHYGILEFVQHIYPVGADGVHFGEATCHVFIYQHLDTRSWMSTRAFFDCNYILEWSLNIMILI
jgi:hypothetical protein